MRYVLSKYHEDQEEQAYRFYITDSVQLVPQQRFLTQRFSDLITRQIDTRPADVIAADVIARAGLNIAEETHECI